VKLAVSILETPASTQSPVELRDWAVDLLTQNSPTKFSSETIQQLKSGQINLSGVIRSMAATSINGGGIALAPNGIAIATAQGDDHIRIWDLRTGHLLSELVERGGQITTVTFSPDGKSLFSGSLDKSIVRWDVVTGRQLMRIEGRSPILGLALSPDGRTLVSRTEDRHFQVWDCVSMRLLSETAIQTH
jgi:WD40 repeat protein